MSVSTLSEKDWILEGDICSVGPRLFSREQRIRARERVFVWARVCSWALAWNVVAALSSWTMPCPERQPWHESHAS
eukprot:1221544-Pleurochrysis_carterae.AAC.1